MQRVLIPRSPWVDSSGNGFLLTASGLANLGEGHEGVALEGDVVVGTWAKSGKAHFQPNPQRLVDLALNAVLHQRRHFSRRFFCVGDRIVSGSDDGLVRVFDLNGNELETYTAIDRLTPKISLGFRTNLAITSGQDGSSRVWKHKNSDRTKPIENVVWSTDSIEFASVVDRKLTLFDLSDAKLESVPVEGDWASVVYFDSKRLLALKGNTWEGSIHCFDRKFNELWRNPPRQSVEFLTPIRYAAVGDAGWLIGDYREFKVLDSQGAQVEISPGFPKIESLRGLASSPDMRAFCFVSGSELCWGELEGAGYKSTVEPIAINPGFEKQCLALAGTRGVVVDMPGLMFFHDGLANPIRVVLDSKETPTHVSWLDSDRVLVATKEGSLVTVLYSDAQSASALANQTAEDLIVAEPAPLETTMEDAEPQEKRHGVVGIHGFRDSPTADDQLGRDRFRASIGQSIIDLTGPTEPDGSGGENGHGSREFPAILVGGSWGSGKSSVLKKFQEERKEPQNKRGDASGETSTAVHKRNLGEPKGLDDFEWKFAHFNAWTNEHLADPAAGLLKALRESATENLNARERIGFRAREMMIRFFGDQGSIAAVWAFAALWFVSLIILGVAKKPLAAIGIPALLLTGVKWISGARNVVFWDRFRATPLRSNSFVSGLTETKCLANWYRDEVHRPRKPKFNAWITVSAGVASSAGLIVWTILRPSVVESRRQLQAHWFFAFCVIVLWALCLIAYRGNGAFSKKVLRLPLALPAQYLGPFLFLLIWRREGFSASVGSRQIMGLVSLWLLSALFWQILVLSCWPTEHEPKPQTNDRILVFVVDDLDRCAHRKVVDVLNLLNTVFQQNPVGSSSSYQARGRFCVVVLGDDGWIADAYAESMKDSSKDIDVGWSFVAKIFDLVVRVPVPGAPEMIQMIKKQLHDVSVALQAEAGTSSKSPNPAPIPKSLIAEEPTEFSAATLSGGEPVVLASEPATSHALPDQAGENLDKQDDRASRRVLLRHLLEGEVTAANGNPRSARRAIVSFVFWHRLRPNWTEDEEQELARLAMTFASKPASAAKCMKNHSFPVETRPHTVWAAIGGRLTCHPSCAETAKLPQTEGAGSSD